MTVALVIQLARRFRHFPDRAASFDPSASQELSSARCVLFATCVSSGLIALRDRFIRNFRKEYATPLAPVAWDLPSLCSPCPLRPSRILLRSDDLGTPSRIARSMAFSHACSDSACPDCRSRYLTTESSRYLPRRLTLVRRNVGPRP